MYKLMYSKYWPTRFAATCLLIFARLVCISQPSVDTLPLSLKQAEQQFLEKNLLLVAAHYGVDADKALIEQAKLWDNPVLITDQNIYANGKFMNHGKTAAGDPNGQIFIQLQQLVKTAGKRRKLIDLATTNVQIGELQLQNVMRNLKYELRTDYYTIVRLTAVQSILQQQSFQLQQLLKGMEAQLKAGNIANKDYLRLQAILIGLQQDITANNIDLGNAQADLKTLLRVDANSFIRPTDSIPGSVVSLPSLNDLLRQARLNNAEYLAQQKQVTYQQQNLTYQKALRSPDITIGPEYDRASSYTPNYVGMSVSLPLSLFNKNQGNIRSAAFSVKQQETLSQQAGVALDYDVVNSYRNLTLAIEQNGVLQQDFYNNYKIQFNNIVKSFQQRQIGMLEFIDFFNDFKEVNLRLLQQQLHLQLAKEELNFLTGTYMVQ